MRRSMLKQVPLTAAVFILAIAVVMSFGISGAALAPQPAWAASDAPTITLTRVSTGKLVMVKGKKYKIGAKASVGKLSYKSSAKKKVSVTKKGVLKAKKVGKAVIKVTAKLGSKKTTKKISVKVVKASKFKKVKSLSASVGNSSLDVGQTTSVKVKFKPSKASNKNAIYKTSNAAVATVTEAGKVCAMAPGTAKITVTSCDNSKAKKTLSLTVNEPQDAQTGETAMESLVELVESGTVEATGTEEGRVSSVVGTFTDKQVRTTSEAAQVLNDSSEYFGDKFHATANEIEKRQVSDGDITVNVFRYAPVVNGVPVEGHQITLTADERGQVKGLVSSYADEVLSVDTTPTMTLATATQKALALAASDSGLGTAALSADAKLVVFCPPRNGDDSDPALAYHVTVSAESGFYRTYYLYANGQMGAVGDCMLSTGLPLDEADGSALTAATTGSNAALSTAVEGDWEEWEPRTVSAYDDAGELRVVNTVYLGNDTFMLRDDDRGVEVHDLVNGWCEEIETEGSPKQQILHFDSAELLTFKLDYLNPRLVSLQANMQDVYDFYRDKLGRVSFDNAGSDVASCYPVVGWGNACWHPGYQCFFFGDTVPFMDALDVVAHEFTHAVIENAVSGNDANGLIYSGESGALNESYADIMGNLVEGKARDDDGRWSIAEDSGSILRSQKNPLTHDDYGHTTDDDGGVHFNSGIFNHAAYLMMVDSRTQDISDDQWADVFYISLSLLSSDASMNDARNAVVESAQLHDFTKEQMQAVREAFKKVKLGPAINTEESLREALQEQTSKSIVAFYFDDFDRDMDFEAYAITADVDYDGFWQEGADVWHVDENGATRMEGGMDGYGNGLVTSRGFKFLVFEESAGGSGSTSHVYGARFRTPKIMGFAGVARWSGSSGSYVWQGGDVVSSVNEGSGNTVTATTNGCFVNGVHEFPTMRFMLDKLLFKFVLYSYDPV